MGADLVTGDGEHRAGPVRLGAALLAVVALAAGAGCQGEGRPTPTAAAPAAAPDTSPEPARIATTGAPRPYVLASPPAAPAGRLAGWAVPDAAARFATRAWFRGVPIERTSGRLVVVYPALALSSDGKRTVAHLKLPVFACARRAGPASPNFAGCVRRRVEYGDLAVPQARVGLGEDGRIAVSGRFPTYVHGPAVDPGPGLPRSWTGRVFTVRFTVEPERPVRARGLGLVATGTVQLGRTSAGVDRRYPNVVVPIEPAGTR